MARYKGPITKKKRRFGLLPESPVVEVESRGRGKPTGGKHRRKRKSVYGIRLEEKQKLRFIYGILEKQFRRYYHEARKNPSNTGFILLQLLERRLDNVVYRLGFAPTREAARQFVNHGHVLVNGKKVDIPSYSVKDADVITLKTRSLEMPVIVESMKNAKSESLPNWLSRKGPAGMVKSMPSEGDIRNDIDLGLIIEYYSR